MFTKTLSASLVLAAANAASGTFDYSDIGSNWTVDGFHSPDCEVGKEQSPIDLLTSGATATSDAKFEGFGYNNWPEGQTLLKEEHGLKMKINDAPLLKEQFPDGTTDQFNAVQLHFHAPSEHTVDDAHLPLEMHIVHTHAEFASTRFSVIGVFFEVGDEENEYIASLDFENATTEGNPLTDVNLGSFLGGLDMSKYWHYDGSFTTPPCTEGVKWWVLREPVKISQAQYDAFINHGWGNENYEAGEGNNRIVQPLNDRTLYYRDSSSNAMALAIGGAALSLLALF